MLFAAGWYFTHKVPLESLYRGEDLESTTGAPVAVAASQATYVTGNGIAAFATAVALWPVSLTDPSLGLAICCILGPSVVFLGLKGLGEVNRGGRMQADGTRTPFVGGRRFALATFPIAIGAVLFAVVKVLA